MDEITPLRWKPNKHLVYKSTTCLCTSLCVCSSARKKNTFHGAMANTGLQRRTSSDCTHALSLPRSLQKADRGHHVFCTVTIIRSRPCLSIYNISLSLHSITRYCISLKPFATAPPQHRNTLQHNSPLLKIDPCEATHSGKHRM